MLWSNLIKVNSNSLLGDEICFDARRQGSCEPFVNTILEPVHTQVKFGYMK